MTEDYRTLKIEEAIDKLTDISSDLNKMIAVHEQRLNSQEKFMENIDEMVEKRREEGDIKLQNVYDTIRSEDKNILEEINRLRVETTTQHVILTEKINKMEKMTWMYMGAFSVISFLIAYGEPILRILNAK
jgi:tRNA 2-selenouridine synthase SelU